MAPTQHHRVYPGTMDPPQSSNEGAASAYNFHSVEDGRLNRHNRNAIERCNPNQSRTFSIFTRTPYCLDNRTSYLPPPVVLLLFVSLLSTHLAMVPYFPFHCDACCNPSNRTHVPFGIRMLHGWMLISLVGANMKSTLTTYRFRSLEYAHMVPVLPLRLGCDRSP